MPQPVTDYRTGFLSLSRAQWDALPAEVRDYIQAVGIEHPQGFGKPTVVELAVYRIEEIEAIMRRIGR